MNKITSLSKLIAYSVVFMLSIVSSYAQCDPPTAITVSNVAQSSATLNWTAPSAIPSAGYEVEVRTSGAGGSGEVGLITTLISPTSTTVTINDLAPNTPHTAYIRSICESLSETSNWASSALFTTTVLLPPVALSAVEVNSSSFISRWEPSDGATFYRVLYSDNPLFDDAILLPQGSAIVKLIFNLESLSTYYYKVAAKANSGSWTDYSSPIEVNTTDEEATEAIWNGSNWSAQPTSFVDLIINGNYNTSLDPDFGLGLTGKSLQVNSNYTFTVASGTYVLIEQGITNSGVASNVTVESNANLHQIGLDPFVGQLTVKRNSFPIYKLDYTMWASPVSGQSLTAFSPNTLTNRFYSYNSASDTFSVIPNVSTKNFIPGNGYLIRAPNNYASYVDNNTPGVPYPGQFVGTPTNGNVIVPVSGTVISNDYTSKGFNLVGNPYPTDISASKFFNSNQTTTVLEKSAWFWRRRNNTNGGPMSSFYAVWSPLGGTNTTAVTNLGETTPVPNTRPNGTIKVGQGFIVKVKSSAANPTVKFTNSMKANDNYVDIFLKSEEEIERHKFYINMTNDQGIFSQILLGFAADGASDVDDNDAEYIGDSPIAISSLINDTAYTIQAKELPFVATQEFALRFQTSVAGTYNLALEDVTGIFVENVDPILVDMLTSTETNLRNASYSFASEPGIFDTRFKIVFAETALGTVDNAIDTNSVVAINNNNILNISAGSYIINSVEVYDLLGRRIYSTSNVDASTTSISNLKATQQIILVKIATDHGTVTKKVQF